jgi:hypothetical protein
MRRHYPCRICLRRLQVFLPFQSIRAKFLAIGPEHTPKLYSPFLKEFRIVFQLQQSRRYNLVSRHVRVSRDRKAGRFVAAVGNKANSSVIEQEAFTSSFEKVEVAAYSSSSSERHNAFQIHCCSLFRAIDSRSHREPINQKTCPSALNDSPFLRAHLSNSVGSFLSISNAVAISSALGILLFGMKKHVWS